MFHVGFRLVSIFKGPAVEGLGFRLPQKGFRGIGIEWVLGLRVWGLGLGVQEVQGLAESLHRRMQRI